MKDMRQKVIRTLMQGGIAVVRTDTVYGIIARANDQQAVERVYQLKSRNPKKSCIILLADEAQAYGNFSMDSIKTEGPTSVLVDSPLAPEWLRRENDEIAYRLPDVPWLREVIREVGPLIAPSANPEDMPTAKNIDEAMAYFNDEVDIYIDDGEVPAGTLPSRLIRHHTDGTIDILR
ncbi:L-threonylcarbamoyladenylate synthase [Microbacteriaceae bacterium]|nr:L-threonylcarbamoyladenylate synthase [Candidatus Saccharibacteria bacterium]